MKKIILLACSFVFFSVITNAQTQTALPDINKVLEIKEVDHDFGQIPFGKPTSYDVVIKNISDKPIKVENVSVGCGCTTPKWDKDKTYAPGETFTISLGYNSMSVGTFRKFATATFSGGFTKTLMFHGETLDDSKAKTN